MDSVTFGLPTLSQVYDIDRTQRATSLSVAKAKVYLDE